ncbi:hypothetical protein JWG44_12085 [Leptospira sp. 201903071]|uniref:LA_0442/LA_0875 N-terminal domain-containing protein n=1 Tax=Leptospira ainazelensis TaxID=2810034 RepID=UPI0019647C2D|nr:DUF5683 domain-containing protein [Leptospira ainazelensis]MBM9500991.1 hypothetical protein [Leptospira ainazelensis]
MMWKNKIIWIFITFLFLNVSLFADIIYLKDGRVIFVKVLNQDMEKVSVSNERETWEIEKKKISRISFNEDEEIYVRNQMREKERMISEMDSLKKSLSEKESQESLKKEEVQKNQGLAKSSLWRSAILPGWGQFYRGDFERGYFFSISAGLTFLYWFQADSKYKKETRDLNDTNQLSLLTGASGDAGLISSAFLYANEIRNRRYQAGIQASGALVLFLTIYTFNLIDAWLFGRPWNFFAKVPEEKKESIEINVTPDSSQNPITPIVPDSPEKNNVPMLPQAGLPGNSLSRWELRWRIRF